MQPKHLIKFILKEYFNEDENRFIESTGYSKSQLSGWMSGEVIPQRYTINYIMNCVFTPEFKTINEFAEFFPEDKILPQLRNILGEHKNDSGLYAFYDSMANLVYLGKATYLLQESYDAIRRPVHIPFPKGINTKPNKRYELIRYISYYQVQLFEDIDYPKHVESLILRISKPILNKNIGTIVRAYKKLENDG